MTVRRGSIVRFRNLQWAVADLGFGPTGTKLIEMHRVFDSNADKGQVVRANRL